MKTLSSFLIVAALLPVVIFGATLKERLFVSASADANPVLRIWFEPSTVVLSPGQAMNVKVMVESEAVRKLVGSIDVPLIAIGEIELDQSGVNYGKPFLGRTEVGRIKVTSFGGEAVVRVDEGSTQVLPPEFVLQTSELKVVQK